MKKVKIFLCTILIISLFSSMASASAASQNEISPRTIATYSSDHELYNSAKSVLFAKVTFTCTYEYSENYITCTRANVHIDYVAPGYTVRLTDYYNVNLTPAAHVQPICRLFIQENIEYSGYTWDFYQNGYGGGIIMSGPRVVVPI